MSGSSGPTSAIQGLASAVKGYQSGLSQPPQQSQDSINPLGLLQQYRSNPFSLQTDMSRPAQFLPPELGNIDYGAQWRAQNPSPSMARPGMGQPGMWEGPGNSASDGLAGEIGNTSDGREGGTDGMGGLGMGLGGNGGGDGGGGGK
jgi:hypothetical protein